ncbi:MAG: hypothetical protein NC434_10935 [Ruminococcus sp.]|nr:hypothetical protein [Ruminococcus sp.]
MKTRGKEKMKMIDIELSKIGGGGLQQRFNRELERVVKNLKDPNTPAKEARKITITLTLKQDESRNVAQCTVDVQSKLARAKSFDTMFGIGRDLKTDQYAIREYGTQIPGQMDMEDVMPAAGGEESSKVKDFQKLKPAMGGQ